MKNLTTDDGVLIEKFNEAIEYSGSPLLIVKDNDAEGFSVAEKVYFSYLKFYMAT